MEEQIRLNKYLSTCGYCSRREADHLLELGRVSVDGIPAGLGDKVMTGQCVCVDGEPVVKNTDRVVIAFHKPAGVVCTSSKKDRNNIIDYIGFKERIYPVGRLDKDSTGLILLTNDGELTDRILRGKNGHEKEYIVKVDRPVKGKVLEAMQQGVPILDTVTRPCQVKKIDERTFRIILTQGLNRQIRRMCEYFGYRVVSLKRIRIMNIYLNILPEGKWRYLTEEELQVLEQSLKGQKFYNE
ncbi:MAG: pseudouridine synthase [Eubacterium sp.]|nr:pseudouridine synthase [Eubacterium sp.]